MGVLPAERVSLMGTILVSEGPRAETPCPLSRGISFCEPPFLWLVTLCVCVCVCGRLCMYVWAGRFIQGTYISNFPFLFRRIYTRTRMMTTVVMIITNTTTTMTPTMTGTELGSAGVANAVCIKV